MPLQESKTRFTKIRTQRHVHTWQAQEEQKLLSCLCSGLCFECLRYRSACAWACANTCMLQWNQAQQNCFCMEMLFLHKKEATFWCQFVFLCVCVLEICSVFLFFFLIFFRCSAIKVAHTGQTIEQSVENVVSAVSEIAKIVPRGWNNIQSLNLKTSDSISLPIYTSLPEKSLVIDDTQPPKKKRKMETWNVATLTVTCSDYDGKTILPQKVNGLCIWVRYTRHNATSRSHK